MNINKTLYVYTIYIMEISNKKRKNKLQSIYSRGLLTRKINLPIHYIGDNLDYVIENKIKDDYEGKCIVEGFVKKDTTKIIKYSSGLIERGNNIAFTVVFECDICFPVEGMLISCQVKNISKAGIRAELVNESPSPIVVFVARDHHLNSQQFNDIQLDDIITISVIAQRFELNDKFISIIAKLVRDKDSDAKPKTSKQTAKKPKLILLDEE